MKLTLNRVIPKYMVRKWFKDYGYYYMYCSKDEPIDERYLEYRLEDWEEYYKIVYNNKVVGIANYYRNKICLYIDPDYRSL
jgi:hypothetical protein